MNNSRQKNANHMQQWSRRRWMGAAIGAALPSLVMEREASAILTIYTRVTAPTTGPAVWRPIKDPSNPGQYLKSQLGGGTVGDVLAIEAIGSARRTVTWTLTGISQGYYKVEILYPRHSGNAKNLRVGTKATLETAFKARPKTLNQQLGDGVTTLSNVFVPAVTNVTPFHDNNAASYIWVSNDSTGKINTGKLSVQLSDSGCGSPTVPGGRIVADYIRLTLISAVK